MRLKSIKPLAIVMGVLLFFASCEKESVETLETLNEQSDLADTRKSAPITYSESEPNNTMATADGPIYSDDAIITGMANGASNWDWFIIPVQANKLVTVYLTGTTTYLSAEIRDKFDKIVAYVNYQNEISFLTTYTGNYYIKIQGYANYTYTLTVSEKTQSTVLPTVNGSSIKRYKTNGDQTYTFTLSSPSYVSLYLNASDIYLGFKVYDSSNNLISGTSVINDEEAIVFDELATGTYTIVVSGYSGLVYDLYFNAPANIIIPWTGFGNEYTTYYAYILEKEDNNNYLGYVIKYKCGKKSYGGSNEDLNGPTQISYINAYPVTWVEFFTEGLYSNGLPIIYIGNVTDI